MRKSCSVAEAKDNLTRLLRLVEAGGHVHITRRGKPVAVLLSTRAYDAMGSGRVSYCEALTEFLEGVDPDDLLSDEDLAGLRDRSGGREVDPWG